MERTLKEQEALKQSQNIAEGLEGNQDPMVAAQVATVWGLIAVHEVIDRLVNVLNDLDSYLPVEAAADRIALAITDPKG